MHVFIGKKTDNTYAIWSKEPAQPPAEESTAKTAEQIKNHAKSKYKKAKVINLIGIEAKDNPLNTQSTENHNLIERLVNYYDTWYNDFQQRAEFEAIVLSTKIPEKYFMALDSLSEFDKDEPEEEQEVVEVTSVKQARGLLGEFLMENDLGMGNFNGGQIFKGGVLVASMEYNGRLFEPNTPKDPTKAELKELP